MHCFSFTSTWTYSTAHPCIPTQLPQCSLPKELPGLQASPRGAQAGLSPAQPTQGSAWQWAHQLCKDALEVLPLSSAVWATKAAPLPAKEPSQLWAGCGAHKAPTCSQGVCAGSSRDAQRGLHVLVAFSLEGFEKQQQAPKFGTSEADLRLEHRQPLLCSYHRWQPLALHFVFTAVIFSESQVMTNSGSTFKFYSLNMKTKLEQRRIKQYPLLQKQQKKTLLLHTPCEEETCRFHLGSKTFWVLARVQST